MLHWYNVDSPFFWGLSFYDHYLQFCILIIEPAYIKFGFEMLFKEIAYGPIHSRRLGTSLGMELMPLTHKLCTFNCVYCECGWNEKVSHPKLLTRAEVKAALEAKLQVLRSQQSALDVITFSGNGEPTLHPDFLGIWCRR